jgi:DNA helicase-2/ATP-dependent DNA helicase PcrA
LSGRAVAGPTRKSRNGNVTAIDGNKLTIQFDRAGEKRVVDSFVERV